MGAIADRVGTVAGERMAKRSPNRNADVKAAYAAAEKKYGKGKVPDAVRKKIFSDPAGYLSSEK